MNFVVDGPARRCGCDVGRASAGGGRQSESGVGSSRWFVNGQISIDPYAERDCSLHCSPFVSVGQSEEGPNEQRREGTRFHLNFRLRRIHQNQTHTRTRADGAGRKGDDTATVQDEGQTIGRSTTRTRDEYAWPGKYIFQFLGKCSLPRSFHSSPERAVLPKMDERVEQESK
jgi:hypothetical protein